MNISNVTISDYEYLHLLLHIIQNALHISDFM